MRGDGVEQLAGDLVGIGVEEADPAEVVDLGETFEEEGESVFDAEIFAVAGGVLADEGEFADAVGGEGARFGEHGFEGAGTELAAQLRDDAEGTGVIAAFGDLEIGGGAAGGEQAGRVLVHEVVGEVGDGAVPVVAREATVALAGVAFGAGVDVHGGGGAIDEDVEWRSVRGGGSMRGRDAGGGEDVFEFAGADDGVHLGDVLLDLGAIALDETAGDDEFLRAASGGGLVLRHFEDGIDRFLFGGVDEGAGVDDDDVGIGGIGGDLGAGAVEQAHHDFAIDQVLGAAEGDESDFGASCGSLGEVEQG